MIPYAGIQTDEALFASPLYLFNAKEFCIDILHRLVPMMVMSYIGTLKTLLYMPVFGLFGVTVWTIRLPMVLAGALTIWIFFHLALLSAGRRAALLAVALLATDPSFLLTNTFDWGPTALEHLLLVTGCFYLVRFGQEMTSRRYLFFGFFFLGMAMWNKAIFVWALTGLVCAALIVFWREVRQALRPSNLGIAAAAFVLGALPLVVYNVHHPNATASQNVHFSTGEFQKKLILVRVTLGGSGLLGYLPAEDWESGPKAPTSLQGRAGQWIRDNLGEHRANWNEYAFCLAVLAVPFWWRRRAAWFSLIFVGVTWGMMAITKGAGGSVHHAVLLWPFPLLFLAVAFDSSRWRPAVLVVGVVLVGMNLLVLSQYVQQFERDGAAGSFTDAVFPLSDAVPGLQPPDKPIYIMDWGMLDSLAALHKGGFMWRGGSDPFASDNPTPRDQKYALDMISDPEALFVGHVPGREFFPAFRGRLDRAARDGGFDKETIRIIPDSNGHPVFEVFRFKQHSGV